MRVLAIAAAGLLALSGCDTLDTLATEAASPIEAIHVETDASYYVRPSATVPASVQFTIENRGTRAVAIHRCGERVMAALDRRDGLGWEQFSGDACLANQMMVPLELAPGARAAGIQMVQQRGVFRLRLGIDRGGAAQVMWTVTSNEFTVE